MRVSKDAYTEALAPLREPGLIRARLFLESARQYTLKFADQAQEVPGGERLTFHVQMPAEQLDVLLLDVDAAERELAEERARLAVICEQWNRERIGFVVIAVLLVAIGVLW